MFGIPWIEWLGYAASIIIAISLIMNAMVKLRVINLIGSFLFAVYGFGIRAYPVGLINTIIVLINMYYLYQMFKEYRNKKSSELEGKSSRM